MTSINITLSYESPGWQKAQEERQAAHELQFYAAVFGREVSPAFIRYHKRMDSKYEEFRDARRKRRAHQRRVLRFKRKLRALIS